MFSISLSFVSLSVARSFTSGTFLLLVDNFHLICSRWSNSVHMKSSPSIKPIERWIRSNLKSNDYHWNVRIPVAASIIAWALISTAFERRFIKWPWREIKRSEKFTNRQQNTSLINWYTYISQMLCFFLKNSRTINDWKIRRTTDQAYWIIFIVIHKHTWTLDLVKESTCIRGLLHWSYEKGEEGRSRE